MASDMKLTRKELADQISRMRGDKVSSEQVRKNESRWNLKEARGRDINRRLVRYDQEKALAGLRQAGVV